MSFFEFGILGEFSLTVFSLVLSYFLLGQLQLYVISDDLVLDDRLRHQKSPDIALAGQGPVRDVNDLF